MSFRLQGTTGRMDHRPLTKITLLLVCFIELYPFRFECQKLQELLTRASINNDRTENSVTEELQLRNITNVTSMAALSTPSLPCRGNNTTNLLHATTDRMTQSWPPTYQLWNYTSQRLDLPDDYHYAFPHDGRPSLVLLESILDNPQYQNHSSSILANTNDSCYFPNLDTTRDLANQVVQERLNLGLPVLNVGMPKAGSSTLFHFFRCSGWDASHQQNGHKMMSLVANGDVQPLTRSQRGRPQAYLQLDANFGSCAYPQIQFLDEIHQEFPTATLILNFRPVLDWIASARHWKQMTWRWSQCSIPGSTCIASQRTKKNGYSTCTNVDLSLWWCSHVQHIRTFVKEYPSHKLIELDLYNQKESSHLMAQLFQSNETCWGHANANIRQAIISNR